MRYFLEAYRFHEASRDLNGKLIWEYIEGRLKQGELTHFRVAVMGRATQSEKLGSLDLGLNDSINCINRARMQIVGGAAYADIKALMSRPDRAVDLDIAPGEFPHRRRPRVEAPQPPRGRRAG